MADNNSPLGVTDPNEVANATQGTVSASNETLTRNEQLKNNDPEVQSQVKTANQNINPENTKSTTDVSSETALSTGSNINGYAKYFNYRGTTDGNEYEPNKVMPDYHDLSMNNLMGYLRGTNMAFKPVDVAYLKHLGVYANNRLIIARRFANPVNDDLYYIASQEKATAPIATVISWIDPEDEFIKFSFNEVWEEHTDTIQKIFNDILSNDFGLNLGDSIPLPGWTTGLQFEFLRALTGENTTGSGAMDAALSGTNSVNRMTDASAGNVPEGNPNLVMETQRRKVPSDGGSGLSSIFDINMRVEYEIKYIPGIDPSIAFNDILANLITMGTSNAEFYLTNAAGSKIRELVELIENGDIIGLITKVIDAIVAAIEGVIRLAGDLANQKPESGSSQEDWGFEEGSGDGKTANAEASLITGSLKSILNAGEGFLAIIGKGIISKYREKIKASVAAMTGAPNAPWHITIGNPRKPIFVSGDMICKKVEIELGKELGYNDLPTEIIATLQFECARPQGAQEIASKFNAGSGRIYGQPDKQLFSKEDNKATDRNAEKSQKEANVSATRTAGNVSGGALNSASSADIF